ncbi:MAG: radical SAM family heme chaperone HemW [Desulfobacter sp.]|nr:MAG: radical SAM family heme chaperone HemW [Desulfobacter sp.]
MSEHIYIHVPFCLKKCRYCDFYSETDLSRTSDYVPALVEEIRLRSQRPGRRDRTAVKTIYFGGGTPSVLLPAAIEKILETVSRYYSLAPSAEITLEANPGTLDRTYLKALRKVGVNRLSLGIQSFEDGRLALLGRIHTGSRAARAIDAARVAGFDNLGLDLIYGLPGEAEGDWQEEMDRALSFSPEHLSCYMLTLEPGTPLYRSWEKGLVTPMGGPAQVDRFRFTSIYLEAAGFSHYEISNFFREKKWESRHNSAYWKMVPYDGFGPSAHSYGIRLGRAGEVEYVRSWNVSNLNQYISALTRECLPVGDHECLTPGQQMLERIMVGLRRSKGIDIPAFDALPGAGFQRDFNILADRLAEDGLGRFSKAGDAFVLTLAGWARLDSIVEAFAKELPDDIS